MLSRCLFTLAAILGAASTASAGASAYLAKSDAWFAGDEAKKIARNILSYQSDRGGWPKNEDTTKRAYTGDRAKLKPTYDNGATTDELRFLARMYRATKDDAYRTAFDRGLDYVLLGQYDNGGWPQFTPPGTGYHRYITFNDNAMVRLLTFVRDIATDKTYDYVDDARRKKASAAFERGIQCILRCQIRVRGQLTAWCAQHDEVDFRARSARSYELATLSGSESVGITRLLMSIERPSPDIVAAVEAAVAWFERAKLTGIRVEVQKDSKAAKGTNKVVVRDPNAPPLWARFYDIETNAPIFADRDGIPKATLAEIGDERRNGYAWYGTWPQKLLESEYPKWKKRVTSK